MARRHTDLVSLSCAVMFAAARVLVAPFAANFECVAPCALPEMSTLFWVFMMLGVAVLVGIWLFTLEGEHNRQRKLRRIQKRLAQIEAAKAEREEKQDA